MFVKLKPEEYFVCKNAGGACEDPKTPWYEGIAIFPTDDSYEDCTIIAYATTAEDVKLVEEYEKELSKTATRKIDEATGLYISPYGVLFGLGYLNNPDTEAKKMFRQAMQSKKGSKCDEDR